MLESPAFRILSLSALRALTRIEIEFAHHNGCDNGKLPVTFNDFERYGVRRHSIGPALDELETLGFATITQHGKKAIRAECRRPTLFLLTTRPEPRRGRPRAVSMASGSGLIRRGQSRPRGLSSATRKPVKKFKSRQCRNGTAPSAETAP